MILQKSFKYADLLLMLKTVVLLNIFFLFQDSLMNKKLRKRTAFI